MLGKKLMPSNTVYPFNPGKSKFAVEIKLLAPFQRSNTMSMSPNIAPTSRVLLPKTANPTCHTDIHTEQIPRVCSRKAHKMIYFVRLFRVNFICHYLPSFRLQKSRIYRHNYCAQRHQNRSNGRTQNNTPGKKYPRSKWYGNHIITGSPKQILYHFAIGCF